MEARFETLDELGTKRFYLQYRFPPSSVGEVGRVGGVNRREVGHGNLAERALLPAIPEQEVFPYSIRAESLITESCGSSSMATVCGCCLAMLDAGVPLKTPVAGVAMGLILGEKEGEEPVILTDILGLEDALGTMDFKVAGNETGITTFQLDIKSEGLTLEILEKALMQARKGRLSILKDMKEALAAPRELKDTIPRILEFTVPPDALGKIIGPKGKTVQTLIETHGVTNINLQDDGTVQVESFSNEKNDVCKAAILAIAEEAAKGDSKKGGRGKGDGDKGEKKEPLGPPPETGTIYRCVTLHNCEA
jgi:polyribonucleotide nucleotidyltransferase